MPDAGIMPATAGVRLDESAQTNPTQGRRRRVPIHRLHEEFYLDPEAGVLRAKKDRVKGRGGPVVTRKDEVASYRLGKQRYRTVTIDGVRLAEHVAIWAMVQGAWPADQLDHINGDGFDNRLANLREATSGQNRANTRTAANRTLPKGVQRRGKRFIVEIKVDGAAKGFGSYSTLEEASAVAKREHLRIYGVFSSYARPEAAR